jgi:soluble lytic murein transglycosylase-like protein
VAAYGGVPPYAETQAYVRNVLAVYRRLSESFTVSRAGHLVEKGSR